MPFFSRVANSSALSRSISAFSSLMCAVLLIFWFTSGRFLRVGQRASDVTEV